MQQQSLVRFAELLDHVISLYLVLIVTLHWDAAIVNHFETRRNPKPGLEVLPDTVQLPLGDLPKTPSKTEL